MTFIATLIFVIAVAYYALGKLIGGPRGGGYSSSSPTIGKYAVATVAATVLTAAFFSFKIIGAGTVGVPVLFGTVGDEILTEGLNIKNPLAHIQVRSVQRQSLDFTASGKNTGLDLISKDKLKLDFDMSFPYMIDGLAYPEIIRKLGNGGLSKLLTSSARSSVREAAAEFDWTEIAVSKKGEFSERAKQLFSQYVISDLRQAGFTEAEAKSSVVIITPRLRKVLPPEAITHSISMRLAAEEDLKKEATLTLKAEEEANRRENEGQGIANLFGQLPKGFTADQIKSVLSAIADKTRADALLKAVEDGKVEVVVMNGGAQPALNVRQ